MARPRKPDHIARSRQGKGMTIELRKLCQGYTAEAVYALAEIIRQGVHGSISRGCRKIPALSGATVVAAATEILNRGWGKPVASLDIAVKKQSLQDFSDAELEILRAGIEAPLLEAPTAANDESEENHEG